MNPSNNPQAENSDSDSGNSNSNDPIPRYGGYKHASPVYEDFEMWNSVCEDAEPGWEWKESQRLEEEERKKLKTKAATKGNKKWKGEKEEEKEQKEQKGETAEVEESQTPTITPTISGLGSPFDYQPSNHATRLQTQVLVNVLHNTEGLDATPGAGNDRPNSWYGIQSRQDLALELEQLHIVLVDLLNILRSEDVNEQSSPACVSGRCVLM